MHAAVTHFTKTEHSESQLAYGYRFRDSILQTSAFGLALLLQANID